MKIKNKISILVDWFLPAYKAGGPIQSIANMVNQLQNNQFEIFCSNKDLDGTILKNVQFDEWVKYNENTQVWYSSSNNITKAIRSNNNILFINGIYSWHYNLVPLLFFNANRKIISARGMLHPGALTQKSLKKKVYIQALKLLGIHKKYEFHASNKEEEGYIKKIFGNNVKVNIAANFPKICNLKKEVKKEVDNLKLVSTALISPMKNHLLILKALKKCNFKIQYEIYGPIKDTDYWQSCQQQISELQTNITVSYKGDTSPENIESILQNSHVFILPSKSENFGHAIYEALISGTPVITSHHTPWNQLKENNAGINVDIEVQQQMIDAINFFAAMNQDEYNAWSIKTNQYAKNAIDVDAIKLQYKKMFSNLN